MPKNIYSFKISEGNSKENRIQSERKLLNFRNFLFCFIRTKKHLSHGKIIHKIRKNSVKHIILECKVWMKDWTRMFQEWNKSKMNVNTSSNKFIPQNFSLL